MFLTNFQIKWMSIHPESEILPMALPHDLYHFHRSRSGSKQFTYNYKREGEMKVRRIGFKEKGEKKWRRH